MTNGWSVTAAQDEVRRVFRHGAAGQAVSGTIWLASAAAGTAGNIRLAVLLLVVGGMFIFPVTQLVLRLAGGSTRLSRDNPFNALAMQVAFTVPLMLPLVYFAASHHIEYFYPSMMVVVGAHYVPFMFLYGMKAFGLLGGALLGAGVFLGLHHPDVFTPGGWLTGSVMLVFAVWAWFASAEAQASAT